MAEPVPRRSVVSRLRTLVTDLRRILETVDATYADRCRLVATALVDGYRPYLERLLAVRGIDTGTIEGALAEGSALLARSLAEWAQQPAGAQRAAPMELFREALEPPTRALEILGVAPIDRDEPSTQALPGDLFDLAPSSAQDLGDDAWRTVVAWGIARAETIAGLVPSPTPPSGRGPVALIGTDLMDRSKVAAVAEAAGLELAVWRNPGAVDAGLDAGTPAVALVDLNHPAAIEIIGRLAGVGVRVVAFGPHVDTEALRAAERAGAGEVMPRSRFFARLSDLLSRPA